MRRARSQMDVDGVDVQGCAARQVLGGEGFTPEQVAAAEKQYDERLVRLITCTCRQLVDSCDCWPTLSFGAPVPAACCVTATGSCACA